jgi:hypothetical protein
MAPSESLYDYASPAFPRSQPSGSNTTDLCLQLEGGKIAISKRTLIIAFALCAFITCTSILAAAALVYREYARRQQVKAAKAWGRKSRFDQRISLMRKEVDTQYTQKYSGCLQHAPENPEMGELCLSQRLWTGELIENR